MAESCVDGFLLKIRPTADVWRVSRRSVRGHAVKSQVISPDEKDVTNVQGGL